MAVTRADLSIYQGDDYSGVVSVYNEDGSDADLSGYSAQSEIRTDVADKAPVVVAAMTTTVRAPNFVDLSLSNAITETLLGRYSWDLQLTSGAGKITTVLAGKVLVTQEVTRT
jgi:hypothetical protein